VWTIRVGRGPLGWGVDHCEFYKIIGNVDITTKMANNKKDKYGIFLKTGFRCISKAGAYIE